MDENLVQIQDAHGTRVQLTEDRLTYGEQVVDVGDITAVQSWPYNYYGDDPGKGDLVKVQINRWTGPTLVIEDLAPGDANNLKRMLEYVLRSR